MNELFPSPAAGMFGRRLKRERGHRIPVTVLTGFLGAGKTTLLRRFLSLPEGQGTAVVVNEFGATGIDDALVRSSTDETVLLGNGCLCCITRTDLQQALRRMVVERERGEIPDFRRIVIETSGLADPSPILQTFATDRALGEVFHVDVVMTVVDAEAGGDTLTWSSEARRQAILADRPPAPPLAGIRGRLSECLACWSRPELVPGYRPEARRSVAVLARHDFLLKRLVPPHMPNSGHSPFGYLCSTWHTHS